jgi:Domain of unknown function (DUF4276)
MKITLIVEGKTEKAFLPYLRKFLQNHLSEKMPRLDVFPCTGRIPTGGKLARIVQNLLTGRNRADHVIALTDVYTGSQPPEFNDAQDAKNKMRQWVPNNPQFHAHAAQYDFEAWLLPYWPTIQRLARHNRAAPGHNPESINHTNPPAHRIKAVFEAGQCRDSYVKPRDAGRILHENDLSVAIDQCTELKALVNTILSVCGGPVIS